MIGAYLDHAPRADSWGEGGSHRVIARNGAGTDGGREWTRPAGLRTSCRCYCELGGTFLITTPMPTQPEKRSRI